MFRTPWLEIPVRAFVEGATPYHMTQTNSSVIDQIRSFLTNIGIETQTAKLDTETFLPGVLIHEGRLLVDVEGLLYPGDLLHEAGHIAVTSAHDRPSIGGNITTGNPQKEGDEPAVLLWTYAACRHLNMDPAIVFHAAGYKGQSDWLITNFESGIYIGLPLLVWMGMTTADEFPIMSRWLRA